MVAGPRQERRVSSQRPHIDRLVLNATAAPSSIRVTRPGGVVGVAGFPPQCCVIALRGRQDTGRIILPTRVAGAAVVHIRQDRLA